MKAYTTSLRRRAVPFAIFWFVGWPLNSVVMGAGDVLAQLFTSQASLTLALGGVAAGALHTIPETMASELVLYMVSLLVFTACDPSPQTHRALRLAEPALAYAALAAGIALEFPALLHHPLLAALQGLFVYQAYIVIFLLVALFSLALARLRRDGVAAMRYATAALALVLLGWGATAIPVERHRNIPGPGATVIVSLDSMSQAMNLSVLRQFSRAHGGVYYEHAVSPGLMTNSTWTAILMHRPVHATGVLLTFQSPDWSRSRYQLIAEARREGYETWSYFSDQSTCYVGALGGFDHNHSSPMGWLQFATVAFKNGSIFIPVIAARLPRMPFSRTPRNQAGTYAYDLRAALRAIFQTGSPSRRALVVAHIEYLHQTDFPAFSELTRRQRLAVLRSPLAGIQDFSAHWQYPGIPGDPIELYIWKVQHLQHVLTQELAASGFLERPQNRLVLFADHGIRYRLDNDNFGQPGYYNVPLITFHVEARDPQAPISTVSISELLGFADPDHPQAKPVVEYANISGIDEYKNAVVTAKWQRDGRIDFRPEVTQKYYQELKAYRPYGNAPGYSPPQPAPAEQPPATNSSK